jgi:hypothetical protein
MVAHAQILIRFNFDVNFFVGIDTASAAKEFLVMFEYVEQVEFLTCCEVMMIFNKVSSVSPLALSVKDISCIQLKPVVAKELILMLDEIGVFHVVKVS